jgi:sterol desaturase/sphingolipid hydroxylase (fatty acid hydroxylase superfamily)
MLAADVVAALLFLGVGLLRFAGSPIAAAALIVAGWVAWGGVEYAIHRWVLHGPPSIASRAHARHHAEPDALIAMPALVSPALAGGVWALLAFWLGGGAAALAVCGLYAGYNYYALLHHLLHQRPAMRDRVPALRRLDGAHRIHHRRPRVNYGVSSTVWDRLMRSFVDGPTA